MKIKSNRKELKLIIIALFIMFSLIAFLYSFKHHFMNKTTNEAKVSYNQFVDDYKNKLLYNYETIKTGNYSDSIEVIPINNNLLINQNNLNDISIYRLNELLINNDNTNPHFVYYFEEQLYVEPINIVYNKENKHFFIVTKDKKSVISLGFNRSVFDKKLINNVDSKNLYQIKDNNLLITIEYNDDFEIYLAQTSEQLYLNEIKIFNYALLVTLFLLAITLIYILCYRRIKSLTSLFEIFVKNYDNFYYVLANKDNRIIKTNIPKEEQINFKKCINLKNKNEFPLTIDNTKYRFKKFIYENKSIYIGEGYSSIITSQRNKIYYHPLSNLPNYNQLLLELGKLDEDENEMLSILSIKNFINMINNAQFINEKVITIIKNYFKNNFNYPNVKLYHLRNDIYILSSKRDELTKEMVDIIKKHLSQLTKELIKGANIAVEFNLGVLKVNKELMNGDIQLSSIIGKLLEAGQVNEVVYYDQTIKDDLILTEQVKKDLLNGILKDEFVLHLQPIINIQTNEVIKYEALLRWNNDKYINMSPGKYIKIAEDNDLIYDLGYLIIEKTVEIAKKLKGTNKSINMNVSPREFENGGFVNKLFSEINKNNVNPKMISIEITETSLLAPTKQTYENIRKIKEAGMEIYLDDFGTGYSSLLNLRDFPVDYIKIDRSFIRNILDSEIDRKITAGLITLAHNLNMKVIAEGIEIEKQVTLLRDMGCNYAQGYYYSKPVPFKDIIK